MNYLNDTMTFPDVFRILEFADRYNLNPVTLLNHMRHQQSKEAGETKPGAERGDSPRNLAEIFNLPVVVDQPAKPAPKPAKKKHRSPAAEFKRYPVVEWSVLDTIQKYWLAQPTGYIATARQLYEKCGFDMPNKSQILSNWLTREPSAKAVKLDYMSRGYSVFQRV